MICPICGHFIDNDDYWCGDNCLNCALKQEREQLDCETSYTETDGINGR